MDDASLPSMPRVWTYVVDEAAGTRTPVADRAAYLEALAAETADAPPETPEVVPADDPPEATLQSEPEGTRT